ncbi:hypothetical protein BD779DRAFT_1578487 [Infundibulicybe gibba]|nr:hypothetical protein BD779DRAFT_1578487 [Infundibulicybe gibba]
MSIPSKISALLLWSKDNGISIDPRLRIVSSETAGVSVYSGDISIPSDIAVVQIPKNAVLSARSCTLSHLLPATSYGHDAQLGSLSRWFGYLQSLPDEIVDIPLFWEAPELRELSVWMTGLSHSPGFAGHRSSARWLMEIQGLNSL